MQDEEVKQVQANKDNIEYYNKLYEDSYSEKAKLAAIARNELIKKRQPSKFKKIFCCAKPYTVKRPDDYELEEVSYSSGQSGDEEARLGRIYLKYKEKDKQKHIRKLWYQMLAKAKGAVLVLERFSYLTRKIYLFGTSKKLKYLVEEP